MARKRKEKSGKKTEVERSRRVILVTGVVAELSLTDGDIFNVTIHYQSTVAIAGL